MLSRLKNQGLTGIILGAIFLAALLVRLYDVTDEPLELHPTRQIRAALIARAFYYTDNQDIPPDRLAFAQEQVSRLGVIEPPILEFLTAQLYQLVGEELPWLGRLVSITFWIIGGWAVFSLARDMGSKAGGMLALVFYLFLPFGLRFSRTLLPDIMMISTGTLGLWALIQWERKRQPSWAVAAGALTGFAILTKSVAGIILILPFAAFILSTNTLKSALKDRHLWLIFLLAALPSAAYYYWGLILDGRLATQFNGRFFPELWTDLLLYKSWGKRILIEFGLVPFLLAISGILFTRPGKDQWMIFAWWLGYFSYGMIFTYHIITHDYYHLPMIPLTAVSLGIAISKIEDYAKSKGWHTITTTAMLIVGIGFMLYGSYRSIEFSAQEDHRETRQAWLELGEHLDTLPRGSVIALTNDYETSFKFYTFRNAIHWPHVGDLNYYELQGSEQQDMGEIWEKTEGASYFLVSDYKELARQPLLEEQLTGLILIEKNPVYSLYDLSSSNKSK